MPEDIPPCVSLLLDPGWRICTTDPRDRVLQISTVEIGEMVSQSRKND